MVEFDGKTKSSDSTQIMAWSGEDIEKVIEILIGFNVHSSNTFKYCKSLNKVTRRFITKKFTI